jgi:hypothetical protein
MDSKATYSCHWVCLHEEVAVGALVVWRTFEYLIGIDPSPNTIEVVAQTILS